MSLQLVGAGALESRVIHHGLNYIDLSHVGLFLFGVPILREFASRLRPLDIDAVRVVVPIEARLIEHWRVQIPVPHSGKLFAMHDSSLVPGPARVVETKCIIPHADFGKQFFFVQRAVLCGVLPLVRVSFAA